MRAYFTSRAILLGWGGIAGFITAEAIHSLIGVIAATVTIGSSIVLQWHKIQEIKNEERRKEELHQKRLRDGE
jgi:uncharacterized membrane protein (Fun14 family)